jgi:MFS family permease
MLKGAFARIVGTSPRLAAVNVAIVANALIWYFYAFSFLLSVAENPAFAFSSEQKLLIWGPNFLGIALSALASASLINKLNRRVPLILSWMLAGVFLSLMPLVINITAFETLVTYATLVGVYFGAGVPVCLGYFASTTEPAYRSRLSGITFLTIFLGFLTLASLGQDDIIASAIMLAACKGIGVLFLAVLKPNGIKINRDDKTSYSSILRSREFLLYFVPWLMFSIVNYLAIPINAKFFPEDIFELSAILENVFAGIFAVVFGFVADYMGRKRITVMGFSLLGLGYAVLGLFPRNIYGLWFYTVVDGVAWGAFYTLFLLTLWGDLAQEKNSEKYYAVGSLPFLLSNFLRISLGTYVAGISETAIFSFASLFLFLAVLPIVYAPETLPEKTMKDRELKNYIEKAKKEVAKAQQKKDENKQCENKDEEDSVEFTINQEDEEKARQLAEKYY